MKTQMSGDLCETEHAHRNQSIMIAPEDYVKKTISVVLPDGTQKRLKTTLNLRPQDILWTLFIFRG